MGCITNNFSRQGNVGPLATGRSLLLETAEHFGDGIASPRPRTSPWFLEHARIIHRICLCIEARTAKGQRLANAISLFSRRWRNRTYRSDPDRKIHVSKSSLLRNLYRWRSGGRSPESVWLRYQATKSPRKARALDLLQAAARPETLAFESAFKCIPSPVVGFDGFYRCLTPGSRKVLSAVFRARREAASAERRLAQYLAQTEAFQGK